MFIIRQVPFDTQDTGPAYIPVQYRYVCGYKNVPVEAQIEEARGPRLPWTPLSQPYSISRRAGPLNA